MENNQFIFEILKEMNNSNFTSCTIECNGVKIHMERSVSSEVKPVVTTSPEMLESMEIQEQKTVSERVTEHDEELLSELDFFPELKGQLLRNNIIYVDNNNSYQYVDREMDIANETNS